MGTHVAREREREGRTGWVHTWLGRGRGKDRVGTHVAREREREGQGGYTRG